MKVSGEMAKLVEREPLSMKTETSTRAACTTIEQMDKESTDT